MLTYPEIAERAGTPIKVTLFGPLRLEPGGPQTGLWSHVLAPGNCTGMARCNILAVVSIWSACVLDLHDDEANDNQPLGVIA